MAIPINGTDSPAADQAVVGVRNPLLFYSERGILYYSTPREESFTILLRERNPLLFYSAIIGVPWGLGRLSVFSTLFTQRLED